MTTKQGTKKLDPPDNGELQAAKRVMQSLVSAFKTYSLYPEEHALARKTVAKLQEDLEAFLRDYPSLRLDTAHNALYYKGTAVLEGEAEENNPAYLLNRDGLQYLEFLPGLDPAETSALLNLLNRNRNPFEEPEGDIVTALWQENFSHILYEEVDIFALESFQFDLSTFRMAPAPAEEGIAPGPACGAAEQGEEQEPAPPGMPQEAANVFLSERGMQLLTISPEEAAAMAAQVQEEELKDYTSDIIDVLLIILAVQKHKVNFLHALDFLEYQFFETLAKGDFHLAHKLLKNILMLRGQFTQQKTWAPALLDAFIQNLSAAEKFSAVSWVQDPGSLREHTPYLELLWQVLRLLPPEIIMTLGPLAARIPIENLRARNELLAIIEGKARQEPDRLGALLGKSDEQINLLLVPAVAGLMKVDAARIYLQMTRHPSPEVRKIGLDSFMQVSPAPDFADLFHLLGDEDPRLRERIISYLFQAGQDTAETLLIRFLEQSKSNDHQDQRHVFDHYRALAGCRAHAVLPYLEKTLLESRLIDMFSNSNAVHIKGAALALKSLGTDEAMAVLKRGGQSMRPDVRLACQFVLKK